MDVFSLFLTQVASAPAPIRRAITPIVSGTPEVLGIAKSTIWNRDSCLSANVRGRLLWTCRDSQSGDDFLSSTASWTNFHSDGSPAITDSILDMYGITNLSQSYFEVPSSMCGGASSVAGSCGNSTRYAIWPDSRSMPVSTGENGSVALYTWIPNAHITDDFVQLNENPSASLYRADYSDSLEENDVPPAQLLDDSFWSAGSIRYGEYGFVITNGTAYLYGILTGTSGVALAKVSTDSIEDKSAYSYYTNSSWSSTAPSINDSRAAITNAGTGGQGTYYWSAYFDSYVWIGAPYIGDNAIFQIATAPAPEGPWTEPTTFYTGEQGSASLGAYSQQAHPGMSKDFGSSNEIYLTYTKVDEVDENGEITGTFSTPIIHVVWE